MNEAEAMGQAIGQAIGDQPHARETVILDLTGIRLEDLPSLDNPELCESLEQLLSNDGQPGGFLGFQSAI